MQTIIRCFFEAESNLSLQDCAVKIYYLHYDVSNALNKKNWFINRKEVDIANKNLITLLMKERWKREIKKQTTITEVNDDFVDNVAKDVGFYASKKFDDDALFSYSVGGRDKFSLYSSILIDNYHCIPYLNTSEGIKSFVLKLAEITNAEEISVSDYEFYRKKMDLLSYEPWFGWITYFRKDVVLPTIPENILKEETQLGGTLLATTKERFDPGNETHFNKAKDLVDVFRAAQYKRILRKVEVE